MKHEYKKHEKELYGTKAKPTLLDVQKQKFIYPIHAKYLVID